MKHSKILLASIVFVNLFYLPVYSEKPNALIVGTVTHTKNGGARGSWRYEWNVYRRRWTLDLRFTEKMDGKVIHRRLETWGSAMGFGCCPFGFDHVGIMFEYSRNEQRRVFLFGQGDSETFRAAILPDTPENEELFWEVFEAENRWPLVEYIIENSDDAVYGPVQMANIG